MAEVSPPSRQTKGIAGSDRRVAYKYPQTQRFIADLMTTHTLGEPQDLLAAGIEFPKIRDN